MHGPFGEFSTGSSVHFETSSFRASCCCCCCCVTNKFRKHNNRQYFHAAKLKIDSSQCVFKIWTQSRFQPPPQPVASFTKSRNLLTRTNSWSQKEEKKKYLLHLLLFHDTRMQQDNSGCPSWLFHPSLLSRWWSLTPVIEMQQVCANLKQLNFKQALWWSWLFWQIKKWDQITFDNYNLFCSNCCLSQRTCFIVLHFFFQLW